MASGMTQVPFQEIVAHEAHTQEQHPGSIKDGGSHLDPNWAATTEGGKDKNVALAEALARDRSVKEQKILAQRKLVHFQEEEVNIFEANVKEARQLYDSQLAEQRLAEMRQRIAAEDLIRDEGRKIQLVQLVNKMAILKTRTTQMDEAREREIAFRDKVKLRREMHTVRVKKMEERQRREREELLTTQQRVARNFRMMQAIQMRSLDEVTKRRVLREFHVQAQQLSMKQQKEAEQLREIQLLKIRHASEVVQLELSNLTEIEELHAEQRLKEMELEESNSLHLQGEEEKLSEQQAKLKALQLKEEQKTWKSHLKSAQKRQGKQLDRQQRHSAKLREKAVLAETAALIGGESILAAAGSDIDASESYADSSSFAGTSTASGSDYGDDAASDADDTAAGTDAAAPGGAGEGAADGRRKRRVKNDAEAELVEALTKGQDRLTNLFQHQKKMVEELRIYHKEVRSQKAREHKRKMGELIKDHEDEHRNVKTEQAQEMEELLETIANQDLVSAQQSSFDKQMDTVVSNQLLGNMLPKEIAEELKQGRNPEPASFDSVTLFFTDIQGFKDLANRSQPRQIVALLNRMYIAFDEVIARHPDLYKVETVMDSFMVCSGLGGKTHKTEDERRHDAAAAAECALQLFEECSSINMSDQNASEFNLRLGMHCGPVLGGVIGTKMPHYCLFGDTVNTASRMCSTSEKLKIQISENLKDLLHDKFVIEERGVIAVKGKGEMKTFWLLGRK
ncbi:hypothetical protein HDU85_001707 [Gaertneriomyces sp. JEL0708]|nr:hypothetical protein HDU85_001707 [Gaertneriomyces sp. JEL0708]